MEEYNIIGKKEYVNSVLVFIGTLFLSPLGFYQFYKKKYILGILYIFTFGFFFIGAFIDIICSIIDVVRLHAVYAKSLNDNYIEELKANEEINRIKNENEKLEREQKLQKKKDNINFIDENYRKFEGKRSQILLINKNRSTFIMDNSHLLLNNNRNLFNTNFPNELVLKEKPITDILKLDIIETSSQKIETNTKSGKISTSTGSMVGRAVVGTLLLGPIGGVVGGATAKKKVGNSISTSTVINNYSYSLILFLKNQEPVVLYESSNKIEVYNAKAQLENLIENA